MTVLATRPTFALLHRRRRVGADGLLALLRAYDSNAEITADERFYAEANLPSGSIAAFASLFSALDGALSNLAISEYGHHHVHVPWPMSMSTHAGVHAH